jgi:hypothetical protein
LRLHPVTMNRLYSFCDLSVKTTATARIPTPDIPKFPSDFRTAIALKQPPSAALLYAIKLESDEPPIPLSSNVHKFRQMHLH